MGIMTKAAVKLHSDFVKESVRMSDGFMPCEADEAVNDSALHVIRAMYTEHERAVLVSVNYAPKGEEKVRSWDGKSRICTFDADAVLPVDDAELRRLIDERDAAPYTGTNADSGRIHAIYARIEAVGGYSLVWA